MAQPQLNDAQQKAVDLRGSNILVSAAAGSGKTTVLVERVLKRMIEEQVDISSLIIMTFTRAAAANMKTKIYERIRETVSELAADDPVRTHLKKQMMKIHTARIGTIDSLCMDIVKENFQELDLDPGFRIADEAELRMLEKDVLEALLEEHYQDPEEAFLQFVSSYTDKNDAQIGELILQLYQSAQSHPDPEKWLEKALAPYRNAAAGDVDPARKGNEWMTLCQETVRSRIEAVIRLCGQGLSLCDQDGGPAHYRPKFENVLAILEPLMHAPLSDMRTYLGVLLGGWMSLSGGKAPKDMDPETRDRAKAIYNECKTRTKELLTDFFPKEYEDMLQEIADAAPIAEEVVALTLAFTARIAEAKKEKKLAGFLDVAHYAIDILTHVEEDGTLTYTEVADQIARSTEEIIIDEYQDTNHLQEVLLDALSAERFGRPDVFLVGDVKQSIYAFRLARPDLFLHKYNRYGRHEGGERIIFDANYRSRHEVIDFTNYVFSQAMIPAVGGIDYADGNALKAERKDAFDETTYDARTEVVMIQGSGEEAKMAEAYRIARRIEELTSDGSFRYGDIAILCRTGSQPQIERMLADSHIPLVTLSSKGFFDTLEIKLALNLFRVVDNPYQDIPLTAVLTSPIVQCSANDLALLKTRYAAGNPDKPFSVYEAALAEASSSEKLSRFMGRFRDWREKSHYLGMTELIEFLLDDSGLYQIVSAMPQGEARRGNLDFLKELAAAFSKGSYTGLFNFIRYIEESREHDMDYAAAVAKEAGRNAVHLMTIHGSKGLEFPVVFLADVGREYNNKEFKAPLFADAEIGFGIEYRNVEEKTKRKTLLMETIMEKKRGENYAEEMRKLYVAMTRAKDKLIITGRNHALSARYKKWEQELEEERPLRPLSSEEILKDNSFLSLLGDCMTASGYRDFDWERTQAGDIMIERAEEIFDAADKKEILSLLLEDPGEEDGPLADMLGYRYPFEQATKTSVKMTASQLNEEDGAEEEVIEFDGYDNPAAMIGSERGTAYHKVFELLDYGNEDIQAQIDHFVEKGYLSEERASYVKAEDIKAFCHSPLGARMKKAYEKGMLHREQQFVLGIEENGEQRLIQGIIDAFFEEEDGRFVLVDYKTDRGRDEAYFRKNYELQQYAYKIAIENATGKKVKEAYLYLTERKEALLLTFE